MKAGIVGALFVVMAGVVLVGVARADIAFDAFSLPVGENPQSLSSSDCDGNGTPDLITANFDSKTVTIYPNGGQGAFDTSITITTASPPAGADCGDFDGDHIYDLAVSSFPGGSVTIFKGLGGGAFTPIHTYDVGAGTRSVSVADLDHDGHLDLVAVNAQSDKLALLFGDGTGAFPSISTLRVDEVGQGNPPFSATVADFNRDGLPDIAVVSQALPSVHILLNGELGFVVSPNALPNAPQARGVASGDLNGDTIPDLAVLAVDGTVQLYLGTPSGVFAPAATVGVAPDARAIRLADFNQDGFTDLAVTNNQSNSVQLLYATGHAQFPAPSVIASSTVLNAFGTTAARGTTGPDEVVFVGKTARSLGLLRSVSHGVVATTALQTLTDEPQTILLADMNGDTIPDAVVATKGRRGTTLQILPGNESGGYDPAPTGPSVCGDGIVEGAELCDDGNTKKKDGCSPTCSPEIGRGLISMAAGDLDGDLDQDLVLVDAQANMLLLFGDGNGRFTSTRFLPKVRSKTPAALADFNGDGALDIAVIPKDHKQALAVLMNDGTGQFTSTPMVATGKLVGPLLAGDIDGNGLADLIVGSRAKPAGFMSFLNDGAGPKRFGGNTATPKGLRSLAAADFSEDGKLDLLAEFTTKTQSPLLYSGLGTGQFVVPESLGDPTFLNTTIVDLDQDLHQDLVSCDAKSGNCRVRYGDGAGGFSATPVSVDDLIGNDISGGAAGDLDGDGVPDVVGISKADSRAVVIFRTANSPQVARLELTPGSKPNGVAVADLNNDGKLDILISNEGSNDLSVFLNLGQRQFTNGSVRVATGGVHPIGMALGDLNDDGRLDVAVPLAASDSVALFQNRVAGGLTKVKTLTTGPNPQGAAIGLLNNDAFGDVVVANYDNNTLSIFLSDGSGGYTTSTLASGGVHPTDVALTDLNGDTIPDIIAVNETSKNLVVFLNDGNGGFSSGMSTLAMGRTRPWDLCVGDFDGDGLNDVAVGSVGTGDILILRGNGDGTWASDERVFTIGRDPHPIFCSDVDGDNRTDIVFPRRDTGRVEIILTGGL